MSLPSNFSTPHEYFSAAIEFLKAHAWIYQNANTSFLRAGVLEQWPEDYAAYFTNVSNEELNRFPFVHEALQKENDEDDGDGDRQSSTNLLSFRHALRKLTPAEAFQQPPAVVENQHEQKAPTLRRLNAKKRYEMLRLPPLIAQICGGGAADVLIDFGAGLGYLSERLHQLDARFRILGLEADQYRIEAAEKRLREYLPPVAADSRPAVVYKREFITEASGPLIEHCARQQLHEGHAPTAPLKMAIVGLHACADLSITSMRLFLRMQAVRQLVIMPCCYHKLQLAAKDGNSFVNFPLSACLKDVVADALSPCRYLNRPFLRLACQQSCQAWRSCSAQQHAAHGRDMFRRALADAIIDEEAEVVVKLKRKVNLCRAQERSTKQVDEKEEAEETEAEETEADADTDTFAALCRQYELISRVSQASLPWTQRHEAKFNEISRRYDATLGHKLAEGLTCLQTAMQKLCENIVLYDRLCYMQEFAAAENLRINVRFEKLLNEKLSPRCYVLIAEKLEDAGRI